nr:MAG TPA: hypothetical protein [Caudoviricetes sp.]
MDNIKAEIQAFSDIVKILLSTVIIGLICFLFIISICEQLYCESISIAYTARYPL